MNVPREIRSNDPTRGADSPAPRPRRTGTAALEFALVFPVFIALVFGLIEFGRAMMVISLLNNASRAGCREAILSGCTNETAVVAIDRLLQKQNVKDYTVTILTNNAPGDIRYAATNDLITIRVSVPFAKVSWVPGLNMISGNLLGQFTLPRE